VIRRGCYEIRCWEDNDALNEIEDSRAENIQAMLDNYYDKIGKMTGPPSNEILSMIHLLIPT
jgi:hypothetical protein